MASKPDKKSATGATITPTNPDARAPRKRGRGADPEQTKRELINAAIASLVDDGYSGTTARSIASRASCNQAAIYYHFGGIDELLVAALEVSSSERLERYQRALPDASDLNELVEAISKLYVEDRDSGHLNLLTELAGGITATPELRIGIERSTAPWLDFVEEQIKQASETLPFGKLLPARDLADLIFSIVIGVELRNKVDENYERSDRLFRIAKLAASIASSNTK